MAISKGWTIGILVVSVLLWLLFVGLSCYFILRTPKDPESKGYAAVVPNTEQEINGLKGGLSAKGNKILGISMHVVGDLFLAGFYFALFILI